MSFCKDVNVIEASSKWIEEVRKQYVFESEKPIPPIFSRTLVLNSDVLDGVGDFIISLPNKDNYRFVAPIPIATIVITGNYPNPDNYLVLLDPVSGFVYQDLLDANGLFDKDDYFSKIKECFDVVDNT